LNKKITYAVLAALAISIFVIIIDIQIYQIDSNKKTNQNSEEQKATAEDQHTLTPRKTPYLTLYSLPTGSAPNSILVDKDGMVWVTSSKFKTLYRLDPENNTMKKYQSTQVDLGYMSWAMIQDNSGFIWFSQFGPDSLVRFDPSNGYFLAFHPKDSPFQMKYDTRTDDIWFTTLSGTLGLVQKINTNSDIDSYKITEFPLGNNTQTTGLSVNDDSIWVTELEGKVVKFSPVRASNGTITSIVKTLEIPSENKSSFSLPTDILFAKNDTLWITEHGPSTLTKFDLHAQKSVRFPTAKSYYHVATLPFWLRSSLDNTGIWFNEHEGGSVAFLTNNMTLTEYHVPVVSQAETSLMLNLSQDPNNPNKLWFSLWSLDEIGVVDKSIPVQFDVHSENNLIEFTKDKTQYIIPLEITKSNGISQNDTVYLNASSTLDSSAELVNMTASFSKDMVNLDNMTEPLAIKLALKEKSVQKGNYTIGVNIGNDQVTRTIFVRVIVD
jgi:streptogramin lyase